MGDIDGLRDDSGRCVRSLSSSSLIHGISKVLVRVTKNIKKILPTKHDRERQSYIKPRLSFRTFLLRFNTGI